MPLPDLIEIVPLDKPVRAEIAVPGSKSITNRALILAALADGEVTLTGALWSEDTQIMVECLQKLGFEIRVENDPEESCNRTITVKGLGGKIPNPGTAEKPLELFVGNAGTAARFLSAFVCLENGVYRMSGVPRMHERPQAALFSALRELGHRVESEKGNDKLPVKIFGEGAKKGKCRVSIAESSQFASALLLCAKVGHWEVETFGENAEESPYVAMTLKLTKAFPKNGGTFQIEPDASSGSYFIAAGWLFEDRESWPITVAEWSTRSFQIDANFVGTWPFPAFISRTKQNDESIIQLGDSIMTAIVISPFSDKPCKFLGLGRLRVQETERVVALRTELTKCGARVVEEGDSLTVYPSNREELHGAQIETYNDHRMAMCFAILGLKVPGMKIKNPACVKKTFPNFFQKLAAPPPHGLGAEVWEIKNGRRTRKLSGNDLFAD
jgi:3-phosphoshikimate 1-carboxyvinyltransferase